MQLQFMIAETLGENKIYIAELIKTEALGDQIHSQ